jgi:hypothetical protein
VHVAGTDGYVPLFEREYGFEWTAYESGLSELSGDWEVTQSCDEESCWLKWAFPARYQRQRCRGDGNAGA